MLQLASINSRIVEGLYCEALVLSDEVRHAFSSFCGAETVEPWLSDLSDASDVSDNHGLIPDNRAHESAAEHLRMASSSEALRATTRMMHAVAWLLNYRAYYRGDLSEFQLRRQVRLSPDMLHSEPERCGLLSSQVQDLIASTLRFYERLLRLDRLWRPSADVGPGAISRLRERLESRLAG